MKPYRVKSVRGRRVWDSRGRPTVEAEVELVGGAIGRAIAPAGASTGSGEALDLRDGGPALGGYDVQRAVANIGGEIARALAGLPVYDHRRIDETLIALDGSANKSRLGGNAMIAVSMACAWAGAHAAGLPLWRYLHDGSDTVIIPLPEIQIFGGGAHAGRRIDIQDLMVVAVGADSFGQALAWTAEVYLAAGKLMAEKGALAGVADEGGYWPLFSSNEEALDCLLLCIERAGFIPGEQVAISLDIAATQFYREGSYRLGLEGRSMDSDAMARMLIDWLQRYPVVSIEDPLAENDSAGLQRFTQAVGKRVQIIGDDYLVTSAARIEQAAQLGACNAVLVKPNQAGTLSETFAALRAARACGYGAIVSARSGESEDVTIAHLAIGWGVPQLKVGSFSRSERMAKWNEVLRIEEALGPRAKFARRSALALSA